MGRRGCPADIPAGASAGRRRASPVISTRRSPASQPAISAASRRSRVSFRLADITQWAACRRYPGGCASNHAHVPGRARIAASAASSNAKPP